MIAKTFVLVSLVAVALSLPTQAPYGHSDPQSLVLLSLVAVALSLPQAAYEHSDPQGPAKYDFNYAVRDDPSANDFGHNEARDGYDTQGSYYVQLPDGRLQQVTYYVNGDSGYVAEVSYQGLECGRCGGRGYMSTLTLSHEDSSVFLSLVLLSLVAVALSLPQAAYEHSDPQGPAKYDFNYAVRDDPSANDFGHNEARDGYDTQGSYYVQLADGRLQKVTYYVNGDSGYVAEVSYQGLECGRCGGRGYMSTLTLSHEDSSVFLSLVLLSLVAVALSLPQAAYEHSDPQGPAKYDFNYAVRDDPSANDFGHNEARDGYDTQGSYYVQLADGRLQKVTYYVNGDSGYVAEVSYQGLECGRCGGRGYMSTLTLSHEDSSVFLSLVLLSLVAVALSLPQAAYEHSDPQGPAKYDFNYAVRDDPSANDFGHNEARDGYDTQGSYYVQLADGRLQKVTYYVNGDSGYVAEVSYQGLECGRCGGRGYMSTLTLSHEDSSVFLSLVLLSLVAVALSLPQAAYEHSDPQSLVLLSLVAVALAVPTQAPYGHPDPMGPAKYDFNYAVRDDPSANDFGHNEARDGYDTQGSYYVQLADGRLQKVTYYVNGDSGYVAEVSYQGETTYPTHGGYQ
ncbi:hypothetical protein Pcinc_017751 [Petrolisthes cinctipes]|uniref:Pro-resilin n=1 Tax=Petrolisthes cinctipes TaxID=88211 RepID=A0AAE1FQ37_PETCI|nr:hypothetical protein Pcinc_017751 [Petrolisthes cinctipes]